MFAKSLHGSRRGMLQYL